MTLSPAVSNLDVIIDKDILLRELSGQRGSKGVRRRGQNSESFSPPLTDRFSLEMRKWLHNYETKLNENKRERYLKRKSKTTTYKCAGFKALLNHVSFVRSTVKAAHKQSHN